MNFGNMMKSFIITAVGLGFLSASVYAADNQNMSTSTGKQMTVNTDQSKSVGEAFLSANKTKPGVVTLPDGLQYKIVKEGKGQKPKATDTVTVHYEGTLVDGTVFDSSYKRGEPATFPVGGLIKGWTEALQLMPVGSTWELYIPASLAYGEDGAPPVIKPNETLKFKVELISIN